MSTGKGIEKHRKNYENQTQTKETVGKPRKMYAKHRETLNHYSTLFVLLTLSQTAVDSWLNCFVLRLLPSIFRCSFQGLKGLVKSF